MANEQEEPLFYKEPDRGVGNMEGHVGDDGLTFDAMHGTSEDAILARGAALTAMRKLVQEREPDLLGSLATRPGLSAEYAMSAAIRDAQLPDVKADLTRIVIEEKLTEGHRARAVEMLQYARAAALDLPEYGIDFVREQYDAAMQEDTYDAWSIAQRMVSHGDTMIRPDPHEAPDQQSRTLVEWTQRESRAFARHAAEVLDLVDQARLDGVDYANGRDDTALIVSTGLEGVFNAMEYRNIDGFASGAPQSDLALRTVDAVVEMDIARRWPERAYEDAQRAHMPETYMENLRARLFPTTGEKVRATLRKVHHHVRNTLRKPHNKK